MSESTSAQCNNPGDDRCPRRSPEDEDLTPLGRPLAPAEARHFLSRTSFGSSEAAVAEVLTLGLEAYVDRMLDVNHFPNVANIEAQAESLIEDPDYPEELSIVWTSIMLFTPNPFQEVLALFWNDHFGASFLSLQSGNQYWGSNYCRLLRTQGTGSFKDLVTRVATSGMMLTFLNGLDSTKDTPNENFARELWELFTLGRDNGYTQDDIVQASRAFTGYQWRFLPGVDSKIELGYSADRHDSGDKVIFGHTIKGRQGQDGSEEYRDVVELTFSARDPAPWIARKLWKYFVYAEPSDALLAVLAARLHEVQWNIAAFLRTVFLSRAFFAPAAQVGLVKSPVEYVIGFLRATRLPLSIRYLAEMLDRMGQLPGRPPGVNGWPSGTLWLSSSQMVQRANLVGAALARAPQGLEQLLPPPEQRSKDEVVNALADHLNLSLAPEERRMYAEVLEIGDDEENLPAQPYDPSSARLVNARAANLLYILAQHPRYQLR